MSMLGDGAGQLPVLSLPLLVVFLVFLFCIGRPVGSVGQEIYNGIIIVLFYNE